MDSAIQNQVNLGKNAYSNELQNNNDHVSYNLPVAEEHCPLLLFVSWLSVAQPVPGKEVPSVSGQIG